MADQTQKVYRAWPSDPPTYHQACSGSSNITQSRKWNYSLFDCCSPGTLCESLRAHEPQVRRSNKIQVSQAAVYLALHMAKHKRESQIQSYKTLAMSTAPFGAVQWIMQTITRGEMRQQYGIEGSCCGDCCVSTFCGCCALIQEEKEAELRSRPELVGYQKPAGMAIP
ncbi:PLAC8-domain-containing protein [Penicillium cosmopolitanum]|uniref:PLAC8-domain-containing protein n=1 Tax=Penicillium cosmopolitanum TaxID=1131564 RepID=A0A9W9W713_9EURO|nr:PLAC8-domain-containing protein [Penicillium cosmopolitanum]KAJ5404587.1 PLAC8-domain-containing protein [Penicillium cosmopolitanum]